MPTFGLTPTGFSAKALEQVDDETDAGLQAIIGASSGTDVDGKIPARTIAGQIKALIVDVVSGLWDLSQVLSGVADPNQVTDSAQDALCAITGVIREPQEFSAVVATCIGVAGTVLQPGRVAVVQATGTRFDSQGPAPATLVAILVARATLTDYVVGQLRINAGNLYGCRTAGTSDAGGGPSSTSLDITDGTAHWMYLGPAGIGAAQIVFNAEKPGALGASALTLVNIATPVSGWSAVVNFNDASVGALLEGNTPLRYRRNRELAAEGNATAEAIRSKMLLLNQRSTDPLHLPVRQCTVFYNDTDSAVGGIPAHGIKVLVLYGDGVTDNPTTNQDIADLIWRTAGDGIATSGSQTNTVIDSQGNSQTILWQKPIAVPIYIVATAKYDPEVWGTTGDNPAVNAAVKSALATFADAYYQGGVSVRASALMGGAMEGPSEVDSAGAPVVPAAAGSAQVPGLLEVAPLFFGVAPAPGSSTTVAIDVLHIATFSTANMTITSADETP